MIRKNGFSFPLEQTKQKKKKKSNISIKTQRRNNHIFLIISPNLPFMLLTVAICMLSYIRTFKGINKFSKNEIYLTYLKGFFFYPQLQMSTDRYD